MLINGLEVAILGIKPDAGAERGLGNMPDFNVCGTGSGSLAALESGPACGANFVPSIFGVMVEEMRLGKIAVVYDPILLMHSVNP